MGMFMFMCGYAWLSVVCVCVCVCVCHCLDLSLQEKLSECTLLVSPLLNHVPNVFASLGRDGVVWGRKTTIGGENKLSHFSTVGQSCHNDPVNVSGAGDR